MVYCEYFCIFPISKDTEKKLVQYPGSCKASISVQTIAACLSSHLKLIIKQSELR